MSHPLAEFHLRPRCGLGFYDKALCLTRNTYHNQNLQLNDLATSKQPFFCLTMASHNPSDHGMQPIIKELESLQLSETAKGYFLGLLKHMDNRDKEWAKVVKMWETHESGSSGPNKAMIEIMRNVQDIFMKDDDFLKHLYKDRMQEVGATLRDDSA
ncbi:hypothetical protein KCV03_g125, partial [Aureobasidium melanogenum]